MEIAFSKLSQPRELRAVAIKKSKVSRIPRHEVKLIYSNRLDKPVSRQGG
jgi:hypothetical protein